MQKSKVGLDFNEVEHARSVARNIAGQVQDFVEDYTTVAVERTLCRFLGIDGVDKNDVPMPNVVVEELKSKGVLGQGVMFYMGNAMVETGKNPQEIAEAISEGKLDITQMPVHTKAEIDKALEPVINKTIEKVRGNRLRREKYIETIGEGSKPYLYIIVATSAPREIHRDHRRGQQALSVHHRRHRQHLRGCGAGPGRCPPGCRHHRRHPYHRPVTA